MSRVAWLATLGRRRRSAGPLAVLSEVMEVVTAQTTPWQPASRYSV
jgi:hypothetical protein